jgi:2-polyprenyl-3-methyl-5-hydroxy-6-metoxy-1,4-benzoquinol methylase
VFDDHADLRSVIVLAEVPMTLARPDPEAAARDDIAPAAAPSEPAARLDVRSLIAASSIESLNDAAERYFVSLGRPEYQLAKPFADPSEAPSLVGGVATLLHILDLSPGMTVLDFGCGTGWLSRWLTQLGCRVIAVDVSPTALELARRHYADQPPYGPAPAELLHFDGRRLALDDGSVDRIVCFQAFHHVPNPEDVLGELARVLRPGGRAAFAEPGPRHSVTPQSQFEMRTYGVVENDIDVHWIWERARAVGFCDIRVAVSHNLPFLLSLADFEDLLAGGPAGARWLAATRAFLRNERTFVLIRTGDEVLDSRRSAGLRCTIHTTETVLSGDAEVPLEFDALVTNAGRATWLGSGTRPGGVSLGAHLYDGDGRLLVFQWHTEELTAPDGMIAAGRHVRRRLRLPALAPGRYVVELDCVAADVTWFAQVGAAPRRIVVEIR